MSLGVMTSCALGYIESEYILNKSTGITIMLISQDIHSIGLAAFSEKSLNLFKYIMRKTKITPESKRARKSILEKFIITPAACATAKTVSTKIPAFLTRKLGCSTLFII